ncbi:MAG: helix-turn-helix transcriptional regulator, partial [Roseococcus sp.]
MRDVAAGDERDLEIDAVLAIGQPHPLAFQEAIRQPALAVGAGQLALHRVQRHAAIVQPLAGQLAQRHRIGLHRRAQRQGAGQHDLRIAHRGDDVVAIHRARAGDAQQLTGAEAFLHEAAALEARAARQLAEAGGAVLEDHRAIEAGRGADPPDRLVLRRLAVDQQHIGQAIGQQRHLHLGGGLLGQANAEIVGAALIGLGGQGVAGQQRAGVALHRHHASGIVVHHDHGQLRRARAQVGEDVVGIGGGGVAGEADHHRGGVLLARIVAGLDVQQHRAVPVQVGEGDLPAVVHQPHAGIGQGIADEQLLVRRGVQHQVHHHLGAGGRPAGQLHQHLVVQPGLGVALDDHGAAILGEGAGLGVVGLEFVELHAGGVVVAHRDFHVADGGAGVVGRAREHAVLHHHHALALGARIVRRIGEDRLAGGPVGAVEAQHHGAVGHRRDHAVDGDVALELRIRRTYIEAIETGRFDALPGQAYTQGFVRSYANYL